MADPQNHIDPTFGRPECRPGAESPSPLPIPKRIWASEPTGGDDLLLSCSFQSKGDCAGAVLWITADGDFAVRVNDDEIGRAEDNPLARRFLHLDLADTIKRGINTIEVGVTPSGDGPHCLLAVMDADEGGQTLRVVSDETWSAGTAGEARCGATVVGAIGSEPWGLPAGGPDDLYRGSFGDLRMLPMPAKSVISADSGTGRIDNADAILADDDSAATIDVGFSDLLEPPVIDLSTGWDYSHLRREYENRQYLSWLIEHRKDRPTLLIDYGIELNARFRIELAEPIRGLIALISDETPEAVDGYDTAFCQILRFNGTQSAVTEITGMRYARLIFLSADRPVRLRSAGAETVYYPVDYRGSFECSDPLLTRIWDVSAYTVHACMQDYVWDGIKRDQLPWMGDSHTEHLGIYYAFGDRAQPRRTLEWVRWHGPPERSVNGIDGYSMYWVSGLYDYLLYTGDRVFVGDQKDSLVELLDSIEAMVEGGLYRGESAFADHAPIATDEQNGQIAGTHMLMIKALREGSMMLGVLGDSNNALRFINLAERVQGAAVSRYWRPDQGDFGPHRQVNAMAIYAGAANAEQAKSAARTRLADGTGNPMTTWQHYYMFEALAQVEMHQQALDIMRKYYGAMLDLGATTFWETYDPSWRGPDAHSQATTFGGYGGYRISLCHGWAAGPIPWLSGHVLGISPQRPGFSHCRVQPRPLDLRWFSGKVPTPHGEVIVEADLEPHGWHVSIDVPGGVQPSLDVSYFEPMAGLVLNGERMELE